VDPLLLRSFLPEGLELDLVDGKAYISLVAFDFLETRVFGFKWPFHTNFPEINLRFYVRQNEERGVVFIAELVPRPLIALIAKLIYNEPYQTCRMHSKVEAAAESIEVSHEIACAGSKHRILLKAEKQKFLPEQSSVEHFFKEHKWGFGKTHKGKTSRYEVNHPFWECHPVLDYKLEFDFGKIYGAGFAFLNSESPYSVILASGSEVYVYPRD